MRTGLLIVTLLLAGVAKAQSFAQQLANLDKMIEYYRSLEESKLTLLEQLNKGSVVIIKAESQLQMPMKTEDIRNHYMMAAAYEILNSENPDYDKMVKRANELASKFINSCRAQTNAYKQTITNDITRIRTARQKAQIQRDRLKLESIAPKMELEGVWMRPTDGFQVLVTGSNGKYTGTILFVPENNRRWFKVGEKVWEFSRDPSKSDKFVGKWMYRYIDSSKMNGYREEWPPVIVTMTDENTLVPNDAGGTWKKQKS